MSLNCNEIDLILSELDLAGSFIQEIIQPGFDTLALYTYKTGCAKTVLICTAGGACRIHETRRKITRNAKPLRFMEFLNAHIRGARINSCTQLGHERIVRFELSHAGENFLMFVRLWSGAANVILCDSDLMILDSLYRRPKKGEVTGKTFQLDERLLLGGDSFATGGASAGADASVGAETLASAGASASGDVSASAGGTEKKWEIRKFEEIEALATNKRSSQGGTGNAGAEASDGGEASATRPLSFNLKVDLWYGEHATVLSRESILAQAEKWYNSQRSRREAALERLRKKQTEFSHAEQLKHQGDLILSFAHEISSDGGSLDCVDYETGATVHIRLDAKKTAQENAQDFYEKYRKAQSGAVELAHDIEIAEAQIARLDATFAQIQAEQNPVRMEQLFRKNTTPRQQQKKTHPGLAYVVDGWQIYVGRDASENDELLRHHVRGSDMWLHVRDFSGGYVFIKARAGKTVPLDVLLDAGNLAVYYSKARKNGKADLYYTHVKYLRRAKNGPKGLVIPTQEKNLSVELDKARLARLDMAKAGD